MPTRSPVSWPMDARDRLQQALIFFRRRAYPQALRHCQEAVAEARHDLEAASRAGGT